MYKEEARKLLKCLNIESFYQGYLLIMKKLKIKFK